MIKVIKKFFNIMVTHFKSVFLIKIFISKTGISLLQIMIVAAVVSGITYQVIENNKISFREQRRVVVKDDINALMKKLEFMMMAESCTKTFIPANLETFTAQSDIFFLNDNFAQLNKKKLLSSINDSNNQIFINLTPSSQDYGKIFESGTVLNNSKFKVIKSYLDNCTELNQIESWRAINCDLYLEFKDKDPKLKLLTQKNIRLTLFFEGSAPRYNLRACATATSLKETAWHNCLQKGGDYRFSEDDCIFSGLKDDSANILSLEDKLKLLEEKSVQVEATSQALNDSNKNMTCKMLNKTYSNGTCE